MYMLSADKIHANLSILPFKGHLSPNDNKRIDEGQIIQFNRYFIANRRKALEEKADQIRNEWIQEAEKLIKTYKGLKVQIK